MHLAAPALAWWTALAAAGHLVSEPAVAREGGAPAFCARRERRLPAKPESVTAADFDGDGVADLAAATLSPGRLHLWRGGPGGLARQGRVIPIGAYPLPPLVVPFEGRHLLGILSRAESTLVVLDPLADVPQLSSVELPSTPRAADVGDLGGDGRFELLVACDDRRLALLGAGGVRVHELADRLPRCVHVLADGRGVVVGFQDTRRLALYPAVDGDLAAQRGSIALGEIPRALTEADLDGDGDAELVVAGGDHAVWVCGWERPGGVTAAFDPEAEQPLEWRVPASIPYAVHAADLDGDGRSELVLISAEELSWSVWGDFVREGPRHTRSGYAGQTPRGAAVADLDADGLPDLAVALRDSQSVGLQRGVAGPGFETAPVVAVGAFPTALACADLTGDGRPEVVVVSSKDDSLAVILDVATAPRVGTLVPVGTARAPCSADLDHDGHVDLAFLESDVHGAHVSLLFGDGRGGLRRRDGVRDLAVGPSARDLLVTEPTGGGRVDVLVAADETNRVILFAGGAGGWERAAELELSSGPCALATVELDGDATPELAVALGGPGEQQGVALVDLHLGGERPTALTELERLPTTVSPVDLVAADLDGDGLDDLVALCTATHQAPQGRLVVFRRRASGAPRFEALPVLETSLHPRSLAAGDLDGDGLADLVVAAQYAHVVDAWLGHLDEAGALRLRPLDQIGAGVGCMAAELADLDGDGRLDIVVANGHSDSVSVVRAR